MYINLTINNQGIFVNKYNFYVARGNCFSQPCNFWLVQNYMTCIIIMISYTSDDVIGTHPWSCDNSQKCKGLQPYYFIKSFSLHI